MHNNQRSIADKMPKKEEESTDTLIELYKQRKTKIKVRLKEFKDKMNSDDNTIFSELVFCLFTPQSGAKKCDKAVKRLEETNLLLEGSATEIAKQLKGVRFHNTKSARVVAARTIFTENNRICIKQKLTTINTPKELREWLIKNITGLGYKESSHFLRNIGLGFDMAILDRHILKNLVNYGAIDSIPKTLTRSKYLEIEQKMRDFSKNTTIPLAELDLLLWSKETGEIFK